MNFKLKLVVASVAFFATSSAFAADAVQKPSSGNGELIFQLFDSLSGRTFVYDLAPRTAGSAFNTFTLNDFLPTSNQGTAISSVSGFNTAGAAETPGLNLVWNTSDMATTSLNGFNAFKNVSTNSANWRWNVIAGDDTSSNFYDVNGRRYLTTLNTAALPLNQTSSAFQNMTSVSNYFTQINTAMTSASSYTAVDKGQLLSTSVLPTGYMSSFGNWGNNTTNISSAINESANFFYLTGSGNAISNATNQDFAGATWRFDYNASLGTGALTYSVAAVPEADTTAMLVAGLGLISFIARRRKSIV